MLLEVKDTKVNYEQAKALEGASFNVQERAVVVIVGANGVGRI